MPYDPGEHHRRSIRLKGYDYAQAGAYFVTICVRGGQCLLGEVREGEMHLNALGEVVLACWEDLPNHYAHVILDAFGIMPNHAHGIIVLDDVGAGLEPAHEKRHGLPEIVRALKTFSARRINVLRQARGTPFWQRNYYEHIIRNERALNAIREYIGNNPVNWEADQLHPDAASNRFNAEWR
jgi:REP element-mobilizing transposase RayT